MILTIPTATLTAVQERDPDGWAVIADELLDLYGLGQPGIHDLDGVETAAWSHHSIGEDEIADISEAIAALLAADPVPADDSVEGRAEARRRARVAMRRAERQAERREDRVAERRAERQAKRVERRKTARQLWRQAERQAQRAAERRGDPAPASWGELDDQDEDVIDEWLLKAANSLGQADVTGRLTL